MGMGGKKVDAIDYLTQKIQRFEERIEVSGSRSRSSSFALADLHHRLTGHSRPN